MNDYIKKLLAKARVAFDPEQAKNEVLNHEEIKKVINDLKLNDHQINVGMNYLQKYYDYIKIHNSLPDWNLFVNYAGLLEIDWTNDLYLSKIRKLSNYWLTQITELDVDINKYLNCLDKNKPKNVIEKFKKGLEKFDKNLKNKILGILDDQNIGLFLEDENILNARAIFTYLSFVFGVQKNKSVIYVDTSNLFRFLNTNIKNLQVLAEIKSELVEAHFLAFDNFGSQQLPHWFGAYLNEVFFRKGT
ncbi:hypothetical protein ACWXVO_03125 [Mycoplasma sp. 1890]